MTKKLHYYLIIVIHSENIFFVLSIFNIDKIRSENRILSFLTKTKQKIDEIRQKFRWGLLQLMPLRLMPIYPR